LEGWRIGVAPLGMPGAGSIPPVTLSRAAASTSGDAEQSLDIDGERYSHILNSATGTAQTGARGVSVIAREGMTADALATSVKLLGRERGAALVNSIPGAAVLILELTPTGALQYRSNAWPM
jgi:thiamine biosynthesis lipoprotein